MTRRMRSVAAAVAASVLVPAAAQAHVSIWPRESRAGATENYTVHAPAGGTVATTSVDLEVPDGVTVETLAMPAGWKHEAKRKDDRIVAITWTMTVPPGEFVDFAFVARNPREGTRIVWTLRQRFADGTVSDWTKTSQGAIRPTALTKLPAAAQPTIIR